MTATDPAGVVLDPTSAPAKVVLGPEDLHRSLEDPLLSAMTFLNEVTHRFPDAISFAPGRPYEGLFDPAAISGYLDAYREYLERDLGLDADRVRTAFFQYGRTNGQIHDLIARTVANDEDIHVPPGAVVVTVGAQEGMLLALRALFTGPDDVLLVSSPCYVGITGAARLLDIDFVGVTEDESGPDPSRVAEVARRVRAEGRRPRALYIVPDFANPSGVSMSVQRRRELLAIAEAEGIFVIEDNPYGFFTAEDVRTPTLKSLDTSGVVIYIGSFAKSCFPGARVGYVLADQVVRTREGGAEPLADSLAKIKSMTTVNTSALSQAAIGGLLVRAGCRLREANADTISFYRENMRLMLAELARHFPPGSGVRWNTPSGGFFVVVTVPFVADEAALERSAREFGVLWTPMSTFHLDGGGLDRLRLSCSYVEPDRLVAGVRRFAEFVSAMTTRE
ncbi:PLP-dependent aminotransferase family protein [Actinokineospora auranticolor]|uniref:(S)-3,5-dihydroxyphenylglycine transaminase n=1 Tax=Actinokineospora auranticolor TaxID=155976 RepID=A0A2S6GSX8_9PSEU|nr:PLP-dependent aminotransferase family protein [Actinokineospora auranticolor]PPK68355.1 (S)-3,5-dihydroxyphenylglycine transaminase [Actinokineospora auranticolor]